MVLLILLNIVLLVSQIKVFLVSQNTVRIATRVRIVAMTFMMDATKDSYHCKSKFERLEKIKRGNQIARMRNSIISLLVSQNKVFLILQITVFSFRNEQFLNYS